MNTITTFPSTGSGSTVIQWGEIGGDISNQPDLQAAVDGAVKLDDIKTVNGESLVGAGDVVIKPRLKDPIAGSTTIYVGPSDEFTSLKDAIEYLANERYSLQTVTGVVVTVMLRAGYVINESVHVSGMQLGWIRLASEDAVVVVDSGSLSQDYIFQGSNGATLPRIGIRMEMTNSKTNSKHGVILTGDSTAVFDVGAGIVGAGIDGALVTSGTLLGQGCDFSQAGRSGVQAVGASRVYIAEAVIDDCGINGVMSGGSSIIHILNGKIRNQTSGTYRVSVQSGGNVYAVGLDTTGGTSEVFSQETNTVTINGIIYG